MGLAIQPELLEQLERVPIQTIGPDPTVIVGNKVHHEVPGELTVGRCNLPSFRSSDRARVAVGHRLNSKGLVPVQSESLDFLPQVRECH